MSFEPITRWTLRCDGTTTRGQCPARLVYTDDPDDPDETLWHPPDRADRDSALVWVPAIYDRPDLDHGVRAELRAAGWLALRDGRTLCPDHVHAAEYLAHAAIDGLPFSDTVAGPDPGPVTAANAGDPR